MAAVPLIRSEHLAMILNKESVLLCGMFGAYLANNSKGNIPWLTMRFSLNCPYLIEKDYMNIIYINGTMVIAANE